MPTRNVIRPPERPRAIYSAQRFPWGAAGTHQSRVTPEKSCSRGGEDDHGTGSRAAGEATDRAPTTHSPPLKSAEKPEGGCYHDVKRQRTTAACGRRLRAPVSSRISLLTGKTARRDGLVRTPGFGGLTSPYGLQGGVRRGQEEHLSPVLLPAVSPHNLYLQPLRERTRWEATRPGSGKSIQTETGLSPLSQGLHADATFLIPRDVPLLSLPLLGPCSSHPSTRVLPDLRDGCK